MSINIKLRLKHVLIMTLVSATTWLTSCKDDENPDTTLPDVKVTSSATSDIVWNTVTLTVEASDDLGIETLELRIDGTSVKTATTSPFDFAWDTQTVADGEHTIAATGTDKSGNQKTFEIKLTVQNILLEADIPSDFLRTGESSEAGYIFLSDKDGKVIVTKQFENGDHIELRAPAYNEGTFNVTEVINDPSDNRTILGTITEVSRGRWVLTNGTYEEEPSPVGSAQLTFTNAATDMGYYVMTNGGDGYTDQSQTSAEVSLYYDPSMLYIESNDGASYGLFNSIKVGSNPAINLGNVNKTFTQETLDLPEGISYLYMTLYGLPSATSINRNYIYLRQYSGQGAEISYPGTFPAYYSKVEMSGDGYSVYNETRKVYDIVPLNADIDIALADNKFTGSVTGDLDFVIYEATSGGIDWAFLSKKGTQSVVIPEIPAILSELVPFNSETAEVSLTAIDYYKITGYDGLLSFMKSSERGYVDIDKDFVTETKQIELDLTDNGSRQSANSRPKRNYFGTTRKHVVREKK